MRKDIREELEQLSENEYQKFSAALIPGVQNMLGIRLPVLRNFAKKIAKMDWRDVLTEEDFYFEEVMLRGMVLSYASKDMDEMLPYITAFIPLVDNWSICDSVFGGMDVFQKNRERSWKFIEPYLHSDKEFEIRVALIIIMHHLLRCDAGGKKITRLKIITQLDLLNSGEEKGLYIDRILQEIDRVRTEDYYAYMAVAWLIAEAFSCFPYHTYCYLKDNHLDERTFRKAIQKITESRIPQKDVKDLLRNMR